MPLTEEEKQKIVEEERIRAEAKAKFSKPKMGKAKKKTSLVTWSVLIVIVLLAIIAGIAGKEAGGALSFLFLIPFIYFLPTLVAASKKKPNTGAIFTLNLLLGWTFIGWVISLVWAMTTDKNIQGNE